MNAVLEAQHAMISLQLWIWREAFWASQQIQGRALVGVEGVKSPEALGILELTLAKKCQKYTLVVHLHQITILLIKVMNSSIDAAVTNIIASLSVTLDKENLVCQLAG